MDPFAQQLDMAFSPSSALNFSVVIIWDGIYIRGLSMEQSTVL